MRGLDTARNLDVDESGDNMVGEACVLKWYYVSNVNAANLYLKFYDQTDAPDENDTPIITAMIPTGAAANVGLPEEGITFTAGIGVRATTGVADNDTGAPGANDVVVNLAFNSLA